MLAENWNGDELDPKGYYMSEKLDGVNIFNFYVFYVTYFYINSRLDAFGIKVYFNFRKINT